MISRRAVYAETLLAIKRLPREANDWAILKLDQLGLSHVLQRPTWRRPRVQWPLVVLSQDVLRAAWGPPVGGSLREMTLRSLREHKAS